jgi:hypothetical protein
MLNNGSRAGLVSGVWLAMLAVIIAGSVAMGARTSTTAFLLALALAPAGIILLIGLGAPPPTVAEVLYRVNKS